MAYPTHEGLPVAQDFFFFLGSWHAQWLSVVCRVLFLRNGCVLTQTVMLLFYSLQIRISEGSIKGAFVHAVMWRLRPRLDTCWLTHVCKVDFPVI